MIRCRPAIRAGVVRTRRLCYSPAGRKAAWQETQAVSDELAYALITPYSLVKSRTGGIIARLLGYSELELVGARMFIFGDAFLDAYGEVVCPPDAEAGIREAWRRYVGESLRRDNPWGYVPRCMLLLFRGPDAVRHLKDDVIGGFNERPTGKSITVRGTYADLVRDDSGRIHYFEPAVLTGPNPELNREHLRLFAEYAVSDGGLLTGQCSYPPGEGEVQVSLVMLKPDNFERRSRRPGNIIDTFSFTGLRIVAAKVFNMTVAQGEEFYAPLKEEFVGKLKPRLAREVKKRLAGAFAFPFTEADADAVAGLLADRNAAAEFNRIVEYMTGVAPEAVTDPEEKATASRAKSFALLYEGPDAIRKVRAVLGSTDPSKAEPGTVRSDFGRDLMRNGAHASDSPANALRERQVVGLAEGETDNCDVVEVIGAYLAESA
jgi:nucleoside diphosphate kinase